MACRFFVCSQSVLATLPSSKWLFFFSWNLSVAILSLQPAPPTLQNLDFHYGKTTFCRNLRLGSKDGFEDGLGVSWAHFGYSWGLFAGALFPSKASVEHPCASHCPRGAPNKTPGDPNSPTRWPQRLPRCSNDPQDGPKTARKNPKTTQEAPKTAPEGLKPAQ